MKAAYSLVIPAYNEEGRIARTLDAYAPAFSDCEIIVVLDGCTDRTWDVVRAAAARHPCVRAIQTTERHGKGGALVAGMMHATADVVAFADADGAADPADLRRLCSLAACGGVVVGSRWLPGADVTVPQPLIRRAASRIFNRVVRCLFGLGVSDTQCGAKAFRTSDVVPVLEEVETDDFAFDVDLLVTLARKGFGISEVPIRWRHVGGSTVDLVRGAAKMLLAVLRLRLRISRFAGAVPAFDRLFRVRRVPVSLPDVLA